MANYGNIKDKHVDVYLQNFIKRFECSSDCGEFIAPSFKVLKDSNTYLSYGKDNHRVLNDKVGRREPYKESITNASEETYRCERYGQAGFVSDDDAANTDRPIRLMEEETEQTTNRVERSRTYRILQIAASTALVPSTAIASAWATPASATPVRDILTAMIAVNADLCKPANAIVMTYEVALEMIKTTNWTEYFKYTDAGYKDGLFSAISGLKQLGLEPKLCEARGVSSYEGCASDPDWETMLGDKVLIFHRTPKPTTKTNCFMFSPFREKRTVKKFYKNEERGWKITVGNKIDELLVNANACHILDDVL